MDLQSYVDEIKLDLTGELLDIEIDDETVAKIVNSSLREVQRYISTTKYETIPFSKCIDLNPRKINAVVRIFRTNAESNSSSDGTSQIDPMYASSWQMFGTGNLQNIHNYIGNYSSWMISRQIKNTLSTDLAYRYDSEENKLYINVSQGSPATITIEYVPRFEDVSQIKSDFWIDILMRMSVAKTKIILGRIRSKYTQSNALWTLDGATLIQEGTQELNDLREKLQSYTQLVYPID